MLRLRVPSCTDSEMAIKSIARTIKNRRKELRINQAKVAEILGITQSQVSNLERGKSILSVSQLIILSSVLRLPLRKMVRDAEKILDSK